VSATIVFGPDDLSGDRRALALASPERGIVTVTAPVRADGCARIGRDILAALGKDLSMAPQAEDGEATIALAELWLRSLEVVTVLVAQAQWLTPQAFSRLVRLGSVSGASVWFLAHPEPAPGLAAAIRDSELPVVDWPAFRAAVGDGHGTAEPRSPAQLVPDEPPLGIAALLAERCLARRGPLHEQAADWARGEWFGEGAEAPVVRFLELALAACRTAGERRSTVAGLAAGLAERGLALEASAVPDLATARAVDPALAPWSTLALFSSPLQVGAGALARLRLGVDEMLALRVRDIAGDGSWVRVGEELVAVPTGGRSCLRVVRLAREGRGEDVRLLVDEQGRRPTRQAVRGMAHAVLSAATPGLPMAAIEWQSGRARRFLAAEGIGIRTTGGRIGAPRGDTSVTAYAIAVSAGLGDASPVVAAMAASSGSVTQVLGHRHAPPPADHPWRRARRPPLAPVAVRRCAQASG
jgi:hypothetical protein